MQLRSATVAPALKALLENFIDYAGMFPPAALSVDEALAKYGKYQSDDYSWMLRWFVVGADELPRVPKSFDGCLTVIAEADEIRAAAIESKHVVSATRPVYCEVPLDNLAALDAVKQSGCLAKIRTGGLKAEAIPTPLQVSNFILAAASRKLPFKATAGLHHPLRAEYALSYEANAPKAVMHGFLNILLASVFAWHGERHIEPIILESDSSAFSFDDCAHWRDKSLDIAQICEARRDFMHSLGSCSFDEPVQELQAMGLI